MNFNHLEYAVAVAKYGSISKAAGELYLSQPYLSGMIKGLEEELGYKIYHRSKSGIALTVQGEQFMKSAKLILQEQRKIKELNAVEERPLKISCYYAVYIMELFLKFKNNSDVKLPDKIREMGNKEVMEAVLAGDSTLGIVFFAEEKREKYKKMAEKSGLQMEELFAPMPMYAMVARTHRLAGAAQIELKELRKEPYVTYDDAGSKMFLSLLGMEDHDQLLEVSDRGSFYDAIMSGEYVTMMGFKRIPEKSDVVLVPLKDKKLYLNSCYVTTRNYCLTRREKEFLDFMSGRGKKDGSSL